MDGGVSVRLKNWTYKQTVSNPAGSGVNWKYVQNNKKAVNCVRKLLKVPALYAERRVPLRCLRSVDNSRQAVGQNTKC